MISTVVAGTSSREASPAVISAMNSSLALDALSFKAHTRLQNAPLVQIVTDQDATP